MKVYYHKIYQTIYTDLRRNDNKKSHCVVLLADSYNKIKVFGFEVIFANISQNFIKSVLKIYFISQLMACTKNMSHFVGKPIFELSDQVQHKPICISKEDGQRLETSDLGSRGIVLSM